jgi:AraC family transcriptional activator of mtrCDE
LIHLHTDERAECPELELLLNVLVRESLMARPGGSAIVRSLGDTLLVLLLRTLLERSAAGRAAATDER